MASWVQIEGGHSPDRNTSWHRDVGYDKVGRSWCIALRSIRECEWADEYFESDTWPFNEGPRWLRIKAIDELPALLAKLNKDAQTMAKRASEKLGTAADMANGIKAVVESKQNGARGKTR